MFSIAVPGTPIPGRDVPDIIVVGSELDIVDLLVCVGMSNIVLACSDDALRHAMRHARSVGTLVLVDARRRREIPSVVREEARLFERCTVLVWGAAADHDQKLAGTAGSLLWCSATVTPRAVAALAASHRAPLPRAA